VEADDEDELRPEDFIGAGGRWYGLLFDNPSTGLPPRLTWCFDFAFEEVLRGDESGLLGLTVEWLPVPSDSWRHVAGQHLTSADLGEPAEASVYYYEHHRFDQIDLRLREQQGLLLHASVTVSGDLDRLGIDPVHADAWLTFTGILVSLDSVTSPDAALARLGAFTDTSDLVFAPDSGDAALRFIAQSGLST
jgi:hypothetical protein